MLVQRDQASFHPRSSAHLSRVSRSLLFLAGLCAAFVSSNRLAAIEFASVPEIHGQIFADHCFECHDSLSEKGGIDLEALSYELNSVESAETWQKVLNVLNSGEMPPEDEPQLTSDEKIAFLRDLSDQLVVARELLSDTGGVTTMRRLNKREYENTIESLLGVSIEAGDLPDDTNSGGFDTNGSALFFSADQFEQYLKVARTALDEALLLGPEKPGPTTQVLEPEKSINAFYDKVSTKLKVDFDKAQEWRNSGGRQPPTAFGILDEFEVRFVERIYNQQYATYRRYLDDPRSEEGVLLQPLFNGTSFVKVTIPPKAPPGDYEIAVYAKPLKGAKRGDTYLEYGYPGARSGEIERLGYVRVAAKQDAETPVTLTLPVAKSGRREIVIRHRQHNSRDAARAAFIRSQTKEGFGPLPKLMIERVEITGPHHETWPPRAVSEISFKGMWWKQADESVYAREVIERFASRAFRTRKPGTAFLDRLHALYEAETAAGKKFSEAIREPLAIVLASPGFLYLAEPVKPENEGKSEPLSEMELAIRLSYFLWSAPPDQKLLAAVKAGELRKPGVLRSHADRLLADRQSDAFISSLAHQWLHMDRLDFFQFDANAFPEFDDSVKESSRSEVFETLRHVITEKRPPADLLKADYVVVNDLLADYYGLTPVEGGHFRAVPVDEKSPRGGLLGMAAIHAMGSDGNHASLVERGVWIARYLLNDSPPPAPPNVPQLSRVQGKLLSPREELAAHMEEAQCAQCHQRIDPIGYGMENFDPTGQWREVLYLETRKNKRIVAKKELPIDASGALPDGATFDDYFGLRDRVAEHETAFTKGFLEALIEYGLGRPYGFSDESLRERLLKRANAKDGSMRELVLAFVESKPFQLKK